MLRTLSSVLVIVLASIGTGSAQQPAAPSATAATAPATPSFDCTTARSGAARLICSDAELSKADADLGKTFQASLARLEGADKSAAIKHQVQWIRGRNTRCGLNGKDDASIDTLATAKGCMLQAMQSRIQYFDSVNVAASSASATTAPPLAPAPVPAATLANAAPAANIPTASRAAMLVAVASDPQKLTVSLGSVVWTSIPPISGQPATLGVKAEADIPALKMHAVITLRRNADPNLSAAFTIDLQVTFVDGAEIKGIKDVQVPQMRRVDPPAQESLMGVAVKISDNHFLVGLQPVPPDKLAHDVGLIADSDWFDLPLVLNDDRLAKLALEKGANGKRIVNEALSEWEAAENAIRKKFDEIKVAYSQADYATVLQLLQPLANKGYSGAQYLLGDMYFKGQGVAKDNIVAERWYRMAAAKGDVSAKLALDQLLISEQPQLAQLSSDPVAPVVWEQSAFENEMRAAMPPDAKCQRELQSSSCSATQGLALLEESFTPNLIEASVATSQIYGQNGSMADYLPLKYFFLVFVSKAAGVDEVSVKNCFDLSLADYKYFNGGQGQIGWRELANKQRILECGANKNGGGEWALRAQITANNRF